MGKFWDWLMDDDYEYETKVYADKDKFVMQTYFNGKKGDVRRSQLTQDTRTGEITYRNSNPLLELAGNVLINHQNKKLIEKRQNDR